MRVSVPSRVGAVSRQKSPDRASGTGVAPRRRRADHGHHSEESIMTLTVRIAAVLGACVLLAGPLAAQTPTDDAAAAQPAGAEARPTDDSPGRNLAIRYFRPLDQRGINVFETTKQAGPEFTGFRLEFGAAFTSQVQNLSHRNTATANVVNGVNTNQLADIGF